MGNAPAASFATSVVAPVTSLAFLNRALISFRASTTAFHNAFLASTQPWMYRSPDTLLGLVAELTPINWQTRLKSLGATSTEPVWLAVESAFLQLTEADDNGVRPPLTLPDVIYIGERTSAVASSNTVEFTTNTAGSVRVRVLPAKYNYAAATPAGALADVTITADGVLTPTQLATALDAALTAAPGLTAIFNPVAALGVVTVTSVALGYPLIMEVTASAGGPIMEHTVTTANVANAYYNDLTEMQQASELGLHLDPPSRKWYWIKDCQGDDTVNTEGMKWAEDQGDIAQYNPKNPYIFQSWSTSGGKRLMNLAGDYVGNFDPLSTASAAALGQVANGGEGWSRGSVYDHDRYEFAVSALLGRTIGYLPGAVSFTSKVLFGSTAASRMTGRSYGNNENLAEDRHFNWYSAEGPRGSMKWGYLCNGSFIDRVWLEDYCTYVCTNAIVRWMTFKNIVTFTDADIAGGATVIALALGTLPAIITDTIVISTLTRAQTDPNDIALRVYTGFSGYAVSAGIINKIGTLAFPIPIVINEAG